MVLQFFGAMTFIKPRSLEISRAKSATIENVDMYFEKHKNVMEKYDLIDNFVTSKEYIFYRDGNNVIKIVKQRSYIVLIKWTFKKKMTTYTTWIILQIYSI